MHILCIALRVSDQRIPHRACSPLGTMASTGMQVRGRRLNHLFFPNSFQLVVQSHASCRYCRKLFRPIDIQTTALSDRDRRPGGRRTGSAPFFDETGMSHRKIPAKSQFAISNWIWSVFFGYFLCAKESNSRTSAKKTPSFTRAPSRTDINATTKTPSERTYLKQAQLIIVFYKTTQFIYFNIFDGDERLSLKAFLRKLSARPLRSRRAGQAPAWPCPLSS